MGCLWYLYLKILILFIYELPHKQITCLSQIQSQWDADTGDQIFIRALVFVAIICRLCSLVDYRKGLFIGCKIFMMGKRQGCFCSCLLRSTWLLLTHECIIIYHTHRLFHGKAQTKMSRLENILVVCMLQFELCGNANFISNQISVQPVRVCGRRAHFLGQRGSKDWNGRCLRKMFTGSELQFTPLGRVHHRGTLILWGELGNTYAWKLKKNGDTPSTLWLNTRNHSLSVP